MSDQTNPPNLGAGLPALREGAQADDPEALTFGEPEGPPAFDLPDQPEPDPAPEVPVDESSMYTRAFWKAVAERSLKTFAQTMVAAMGVTSTGVVGGLDWRDMGAIAIAAAVASVLTSLAGVSGPQKDAKTGA